MSQEIIKLDYDVSSKVKVFMIDSENDSWQDMGTGHLQFDYINQNIQVYAQLDDCDIVDSSNCNQSTLIIEQKLTHAQKFDRQNSIMHFYILGNIIIWKDQPTGKEIALSFIDQHLAQQIWLQICKVIGHNKSQSKGSQESQEHSIDLDFRLEPSVENLSHILDESNFNRDYMANYIIENKGYLDNLSKLFNELETHNDTESLKKLYEIYRNLILSGNQIFLSQILQNKYYEVTFGIMEYNFNYQVVRNKYRNFINSLKLNNCLNIQDPKILYILKENQILAYFRDSVVSTFIDEFQLQTINEFIYYNNQDIVAFLCQNNDLIVEFVSTNNNTMQVVQFFYELFQILRDIQQSEHRRILIRNLETDKFIYRVLDTLIQFIQSGGDQSDNQVLKCFEIIQFIIDSFSQLFIEYFLDDIQNDEVVDMLTQQMKSKILGIQTQSYQIIKQLLDIQQMQRVQIADIVYPQILQKQVQQLEEHNVINFVDLMDFIIQQQDNRIRTFIIQNQLIKFVYKECHNKVFQLGQLKLFRAVLKDEFLVSYFISNKVVDHVVGIYIANIYKYNLLNSICLSIFDFVYKNQNKKVVKYIVENYYQEVVQKKTDLQFTNLNLRYEQMMHQQEHHQTYNGNSVKLSLNPQEIENDDIDNYFNQDDNENQQYVEYEDSNNDQNVINFLTNLEQTQKEQQFDHDNSNVFTQLSNAQQLTDNSITKKIKFQI